MAEQITQEITALPEAPKEGEGFRARAAAYLGNLVPFASQLAAWRVQVNAVADWINSMSWHVETQVAMADGAKSSAVTAAMQSSNSADRSSTSAQESHAAAIGAGQSATQAIEAAANSGVFRDQAVAAKNEAMASAASVSKGTDPGQLVRAGDLGTAAFIDQTWLFSIATWDALSCANAAQVSTTVAVPGAEIGDKVFPSASITLSGLNLRGEVTAAEVVTLYLSNLTGVTVDLVSATYYVAVLKRTPAR